MFRRPAPGYRVGNFRGGNMATAVPTHHAFTGATPQGSDLADDSRRSTIETPSRGKYARSFIAAL